MQKKYNYPFTAIVGQEKMKEAVILNLVNPALGGVLIRGQKGTAKTTLVRSIPQLINDIKVVEIPANATEDRVSGTIDIEEVLKNGEKKFETLMYEIASHPIHFFLDFNAVIVNLSSLPLEGQKSCLIRIEDNIKTLKMYLEENLDEKVALSDIPETGLAVLQQQYILVQAIETWLTEMKAKYILS